MGSIDITGHVDLNHSAIRPTPCISMDKHAFNASADKEGIQVQANSIIPDHSITSRVKERKDPTHTTSTVSTTNQRKKNIEVPESKTQTSAKHRYSYINVSRGIWKCSTCLSNPNAVASSSWQGHSPPPKAFVEYHTGECTGPYSRKENNPGSSLLAADQLIDTDASFEEFSQVDTPSNSFPISIKEDLPSTSTKGLSKSNSHDTVKIYEPPPPTLEIDLVPPEDRRTITDQTAFVLEQMKICYFDGKSALRPAGFPGLACIHCSEKRGGRKYFWSTSNRFTNNGSTLTKHIEECKFVPDSVRERLAFYKSYHNRQMEILPRGCLGSFYRRMFLRIHGTTTPLFSWDAKVNPKESKGSATKNSVKTASKVPRNPKSPTKIDVPVTNLSATNLPDSDDKSGMDATIPIALETISSEPQPAGLCLVHIDDIKYMSAKERDLRKNVEVFKSSAEEHSLLLTHFPHFPIVPGTVGIRCIHCSMKTTCKGMSDFSAFAFPKKIDQLRPTVLQLSSHFGVCSNAPQATRDLFKQPISTRNKKITDNYYRDSAVTKFGFYDSNTGIKAKIFDVTLNEWTSPVDSTEINMDNTATTDVEDNARSIDKEFNATSIVETLCEEARTLQSEFQPPSIDEEAHKEMADNCDELHKFSNNEEVLEDHGMFDHFANINTVTPSSGTKRQLDDAQAPSPAKKPYASLPASIDHDDSFPVPEKAYEV